MPGRRYTTPWDTIDRFMEGSLAADFESGLIIRIVQRAEELSSEIDI